MLRFTIRDLFWLTLVVAALLGWWVDRGRWVEYSRSQVRRAEYSERKLQELTGVSHADATAPPWP